jgi:Kef-type K+ transport system membrane component KefB
MAAVATLVLVGVRGPSLSRAQDAPIDGAASAATTTDAASSPTDASVVGAASVGAVSDTGSPDAAAAPLEPSASDVTASGAEADAGAAPTGTPGAFVSEADATPSAPADEPTAVDAGVTGAGDVEPTGGASGDGAGHGTGPARPADREAAAGSTEAASSVIKTILGLVALFALAYVGAHPRVRRIERALGISQVVTAGFPFVAAGLIARHPAVDILNDDVLRKLAPLLDLGLGWIGFLTGYQFEARLFDGLPKGTARVVSIMTSVPFLGVVAACGGLLLLFGQPWADATFLRDAIVLGTAATITAPVSPSFASERGISPETQALVARVGLLDDIAGVIGLLFLGAYFRPTAGALEVGWQLPGTAWLFVTLGLGMTGGVLAYVIMRRPATNTEQIALVVATIAFGAGAAAYLRLSPVVVCFIAGVILGNLPGDYRQPVRKVLRLLERPIYLIFLVFAGALWNVGDWRGWVLMPVFVAARIVGRIIGVRTARRGEGGEEVVAREHGLVASPMGALSIAIVISFQTLFSGRAVPWIVTAVIGGAIVTEVFVQFAYLGRGGGRASPTSPVAGGAATEAGDASS